MPALVASQSAVALHLVILGSEDSTAPWVDFGLLINVAKSAIRVKDKIIFLKWGRRVATYWVGHTGLHDSRVSWIGALLALKLTIPLLAIWVLNHALTVCSLLTLLIRHLYA